MIIRTFQKSYLTQYIFLALLHLLLWGGAFISPQLPANSTNAFLGPAYTLLVFLLGSNPYIYVGIGFVLVLFSSAIFNHSLEKNNLTGSNSLIAGMVFIVLMSLFPSLQTLHQALIPGLLMIIVLDYVFDIFSMEEAYTKVFNSGFFIAISSFFYFPSIAFLLFVWFSFILYRLYNWREWVILLFGFLTPYIILWTYFFWTDDLAMVFQAYGEYFTPKAIFTHPAGNTILNYVSFGLVVLMFIRSFFIQVYHLQENVISVRKRFWAVILFLIISLISFLFSGSNTQLHFVSIQVSMALVIQGMMFKLKKFFFTELVLGILIILLLINNYYVAIQSL